MAKPNFRQTVAEEMIRHIEAGTAPWQKPWQPDVIRSAPFNPLTNRTYRGINAWWLDVQGHADPRWMTYRQARQADAQVRKGEKGTLVEYWKWTDRVPLLDETGQPVVDEAGKTRMREVRLDRPRVFHAVVFNAEQIEGLAPYQAPAPSFEPVEEAEKVLAAGEVAIHHDQADRAFYRPARDTIHLPDRAAFKSAYDYYATALHELGHATGHDSRLGREFGPRGSEAYAKEELRAEMAAFMVATELGLGHYPERHAAYVGSWLKALKDDHNLLFAAARDAEKIRTWVMEPELRPTLVQGQRRSQEAAASIPLPSLGHATARLHNGALEIETGQAIELFGGPTPLVAYAVENGLSARDLGAALRLVGEAAPARPGAVLDLARDQLQDKDLLLDGQPTPGQYVGAVVHIGDRYAVQQVGTHLVAHDLAAMDFDGASVASLVQARDTGQPVTFEHATDGRLTLGATYQDGQYLFADGSRYDLDAGPIAERTALQDWLARAGHPALAMAPDMAPPEPSREPSVEETVAMMDAAMARVPEVERPVLSWAFNSLERRDQRGIEETLARVNWMVLAAEQTQAPDGPALMDAFSRTRWMDWFSGYSDSSEERERGWEAIENLKADLTSLAARSDLNRDLLSVMWHHKVPKEYARRPEWVVPLDDLRTDQVRAFAADPQRSLVMTSAGAQRPEAVEALKDATLKRVPRRDQPALAAWFDHLKPFDQAGIDGTIAGLNWMVLAAERTQAPDGAELAAIYSDVFRMDWRWDMSDSRERYVSGRAEQERVFARLEDLAGRSELNRELLSVMWHHDAPADFATRPEWVVPLSDLRTDQVRAFAADPQRSLVMTPAGAQKPEAVEALKDAALARVPADDYAPLADRLDLLTSVDQVSVNGAIAGLNWMVLAAERTQAPDGAELAAAYGDMVRMDWSWELSDAPERVHQARTRQQDFLGRLTDLAARSDLNRDLLSVMWHHDAPADFATRPEWVVPLDDLRNDQVRAFASDPQNSLVALSSQGVDQAPARTIASDPSVQEVDGEVWWNQRLEDAYEGAQDAEDLAEALAALGPEPAPGEKVLVDANGNRVNHPAPDQPQAERRYLDVPFAEKAQAKAVGAKWDPARKSWYAPAEADPAALARWTPTDRTAAVERAPARGKEATVTDKTERVYLAVPYAEKDAAKALGAKWDRRRKSWYAPEGVDTAALAKWLPAPQAAKTQGAEVPAPQEEFAEALRAHGLRLEGPPAMDGRWHRVPVEGEAKGKLSGSYRGFLDGRPAGQIMNYKTGDKAVQWVATGNRPDPAERERLKAEAATRKAEQDRALNQRHREVAKRAFGIWSNAAPAPADHPYLQAKGIAAKGLRVDDKGALLVSMHDAKGFIWNLQAIQPDGTKRFLKDGRKTGLMHLMEGRKTGPMLVAEGLATAASLNRASGQPVAVAFDAGNLEPVAKTLRGRGPGQDLVIAADDDHATRTNAGLTKAKAAAEAVDGRVIAPPLTQSEKAASLTDFNDLEKARGKAAFEALLKKALGQDKARERTPGRQASQRQAQGMAV